MINGTERILVCCGTGCIANGALGVADASGLDRALVLGDSLSSDIAAAANAGVDACWYNPHGAKNGKNLPVAYEIADLDEVDAILTGEGA